MKIALLGDLAFFGKNAIENNPNVFDYFSEVADVLKDFDHVVGNLETPFVTNQKPNGAKSAYIKSNPKNVQLLKHLNVDIVNLANNHIYDFGVDSLRLTQKTLDENGIKYFGLDDKELLLDNNGSKICFQGYCCVSSNPVGINEGLNILNVEKVEKRLRENHAKDIFNILSIHCGQEHVHTPNYDHVRMARQFSEICPYLFYGHHPHVIQGVETQNDALLAYSLGNFCFDDIYNDKSTTEPFVALSDANKKSFILAIDINEEGIVSSEYIPVRMGEKELEVGSEEILKEIQTYSKELAKEKSKYISERQAKRQVYVNSRKEMRNFQWYISRLNLNSVNLILSARNNKKLYQEHIARHLK